MKLKKIFFGLLGAIIMANSVPVIAADQIDIYIDGEILQTEVPPTIINNRTMLPVAAVSEAVGCQVEWDGNTREVTVIFPSQSGKMVMQINNTTVHKTTEDFNTGSVNEETITIDSPPVIVNNRTLVPLAFIAETLGFKVEWDGNTRTVYLYSALYGPNMELLNGSYSWDGSGQFTNKILRVKNLSDGIFLFEFEMDEGSETEGGNIGLIVPGIISVDEEGSGTYESLDNPYVIGFSMQPGEKINITHTGEIAIPPDGTYTFVESWVEFSPLAVAAMIEHLPTAATSLNSYNSGYVISCQEEPGADGFYLAEAASADGAVFAKFRVASDLSSVYRVDDDMEPVQIFGM
jgi:hypothetical protein